MDEQRFWEAAYLAAVSCGPSAGLAPQAIADAALVEWRKRWGKGEAPAFTAGDRVRYRDSDEIGVITGPDAEPGWWMVQWGGEDGCHVEPADALIKEP